MTIRIHKVRPLILFMFSAWILGSNCCLVSAEGHVPAAAATCAACHGEDGNKMITPDTPKLGGQAADYLAKALEQYKTGVRKHPIMGAMAAGLSAQDIEDLASYYASQESQLYSKY